MRNDAHPTVRIKRSVLIFFLAILALFCVGAMYHLLSMQYTSGDAYPSYSSYAAQPMGTGAFYDALESMPGLSLSRHIEPITKLSNGTDTTLFLIGATTSDDPESAITAIEHFITTGGRLVVGFLPETGEPDVAELLSNRRRGGPPDADEDTDKDDPDTEENSGAENESAQDEDGELGEASEREQDRRRKEREEELQKRISESMMGNLTSIADRWGFAFEHDKLTVSDEGEYEPTTVTRVVQDARLPEKLSWWSALYFSALDDQWTALYDRQERVVLMERTWGNGSIALASDSFLFTNEAMRNARSADLLTWFVGENAHVVFDESHLGVIENQGIATLARKYDLEWLAFGIILTALLFVWKSLVSLVPKRAHTGPVIDHSGKDTLSGLSNLFQRNIPKPRILRACLDEWERTHSRSTRIPSNTRMAIRQLVEREEQQPTGKNGPVDAYKQICSILEERKHLT